jgi:hypothetical protein
MEIWKNAEGHEEHHHSSINHQIIKQKFEIKELMTKFRSVGE